MLSLRRLLVHGNLKFVRQGGARLGGARASEQWWPQARAPGRQGHGATGLVIQRARRGREREESTLILLPGTRARANQRPAPRCPSPSLADTFTCALGVTSD